MLYEQQHYNVDKSFFVMNHCVNVCNGAETSVLINIQNKAPTYKMSSGWKQKSSKHLNTRHNTLHNGEQTTNHNFPVLKKQGFVH